MFSITLFPGQALTIGIRRHKIPTGSRSIYLHCWGQRLDSLLARNTRFPGYFRLFFRHDSVLDFTFCKFYYSSFYYNFYHYFEELEYYTFFYFMYIIITMSRIKKTENIAHYTNCKN